MSKSNHRLKALFQNLTTYHKYGVVGSTVRLEASTVCQLKCPVCPTGKGEMGVLGRGYLKFKDFKKFTEQYPFVQSIELSNYGEIFLNPELPEIIQYAYENNIVLNANNGVNLNNARDEALEALVKYRFGGLVVALDGATPETYQIYRHQGHFENVIENIKKINFYKEKYKSLHPYLTWQFVVFGHNEHEIAKAKELAQGLNMSFLLKENWDPTYAPIKSRKSVNEQYESEKISPAVVATNKNRPYCKQLWLSPQINWDGKLVGCCVNNSVEFGNVFEEGLDKCMKNKDYRYMQEMLLGRKEPRKDLPCYTCSEFQDRTAVYERLKIFRNPVLLLWSYAFCSGVKPSFPDLTKVKTTAEQSWKNMADSIDRNIGRVGIFLRKYFPAVYEVLARIIKKR